MTDILAVQIVKAARDALNTNRPAGVPEVTLRRVYPGEKITGPRMGVFLGDETLDPPIQSSRQDPRARRRTQLAVQCAAVTDDPAQIDESTQEMLAWATEVLGSTTLNISGCTVRETATTRRAEYQDLFVCVATAIYDVSYISRRTDQRQT